MELMKKGLKLSVRTNLLLSCGYSSLSSRATFGLTAIKRLIRGQKYITKYITFVRSIASHRSSIRGKIRKWEKLQRIEIHSVSFLIVSFFVRLFVLSRHQSFAIVNIRTIRSGTRVASWGRSALFPQRENEIFQLLKR